MGALLTRSVEFNVTPRTLPRKKPHRKRHKHRQHRTRSTRTLATSTRDFEEYANVAEKLVVSATATTALTESKPSVLIVESNSVFTEDSLLKPEVDSGFQLNRCKAEFSIPKIRSYESIDDIEELEATLANFPVDDETDTAKLAKFADTWKHALSYPHAKLGRSTTPLPLAATNVLTTKISQCQRLGRKCTACSAGQDKEMFEGLLRIESLEKFMDDLEDIELYGAGSSIMFKQELRQRKLYEMILNPDDTVPQDSQVSVDEDLSVEFIVHLPPRVHLKGMEREDNSAVPTEKTMNKYMQDWDNVKRTITQVSLTSLQHASNSSTFVLDVEKYQKQLAKKGSSGI